MQGAGGRPGELGGCGGPRLVSRSNPPPFGPDLHGMAVRRCPGNSAWLSPPAAAKPTRMQWRSGGVAVALLATTAMPPRTDTRQGRLACITVRIATAAAGVRCIECGSGTENQDAAAGLRRGVYLRSVKRRRSPGRVERVRFLSVGRCRSRSEIDVRSFQRRR